MCFYGLVLRRWMIFTQLFVAICLCNCIPSIGAPVIYPAKGYKYEIIARGQNHVDELAINPLTNQLYFVRCNSGYMPGWDYSEVGNSQGIYELKNGKAVFRFDGAGDNWGNIQHTYMCFGYANDLYVYTETYLSTDLFYYSTTNNNLVAYVSDCPLGYQNLFGGLCVNPQNKILYIDKCLVKTASKMLKGKAVRDIDDIDSYIVGAEGNFYRFDKEKLVTIRNKKTISEVTIDTMQRVCGKDGDVLEGNKIVYDPVTRNLISIGSIYGKSSNDFREAIFSISPRTGRASRIASVNINMSNGDLEIDKYGNIYRSIPEYDIIVKFSKKTK